MLFNSQRGLMAITKSTIIRVPSRQTFSFSWFIGLIKANKPKVQKMLHFKSVTSSITFFKKTKGVKNVILSKLNIGGINQVAILLKNRT